MRSVPRLLPRRARLDGAPDRAYDDQPQIEGLLDTLAAGLGAGIVLLDGYDVVVANDAAMELRVVRGTALVSPGLSRVARDARRLRDRVQEDVEIAWGATQRVLRVTAAPVPRTDRVVIVLVDLTEPRRVEAVRRDFVASISHELKTPVGGLMLLAEAIRDAGDDPAAARRFATRMTEEAERLSQLVRDLIELSRLQGGEPLPESVAVPVQRVVADAVDRVRVATEARGVQIVVADANGTVVWGDARSLSTAIVNLLTNALHYSLPNKRIAVGVRRLVTDTGEEVEISVSDEGIGIAACDLDRIFERFYRADPARARATGGTGLGLAIVKHIMENAGGRVSVWSQPGVGSTFTLHLPTPPARGRDGVSGGAP
jgi:two-component system sensor histidine kinase SenX3